VPELEWQAQTVPHYDWLLEAPAGAAALTGGHCVPVAIPALDRFVAHKLYASAARTSDPTKADKDLRQAAALAAIAVEQHDLDLRAAWRSVPSALRAAMQRRLAGLRRLLAEHPQAVDALEQALR
jgi:hypothetical protein